MSVRVIGHRSSRSSSFLIIDVARLRRMLHLFCTKNLRHILSLGLSVLVGRHKSISLIRRLLLLKKNSDKYIEKSFDKTS